MDRGLRRSARSKVDPIDWVERIPFSETRNYVQRIIENIQICRARFGGGTRLMIEADLRAAGPAPIRRAPFRT
jgi:soluble lytic murein transglycosylase